MDEPAIRAVVEPAGKGQPAAFEPRSNADIGPCLSVVVPVYNEEATVAKVLAQVLA